MKLPYPPLVVVALVGVVAHACSSPAQPPGGQQTPGTRTAGLDQKTFDGVYRAGKALESAIDTSVNLIRYTELVQTFATELSIVADRATEANEKKLVSMYEDTKTAYRDALAVWQLKGDGRSEWLYAGPALNTLLTPYNIVFEHAVDHPFTLRGDMSRTSADAALRSIWTIAAQRLDAANKVLNAR